jgi:hypothetical protein
VCVCVCVCVWVCVCVCARARVFKPAIRPSLYKSHHCKRLMPFKFNGAIARMSVPHRWAVCLDLYSVGS